MIRLRFSLVLLSLATSLSFGRKAAHAQSCEYPQILLTIDRSISMYNGRIDGARKWDIAQQAITNILGEFGAGAHFGLMIYPGPSGEGAAGIEGPVGACRYNRSDVACTPQSPRCSTGEIVVDIGGRTEQAILDALVWPEGLSSSYTPTWQSLAAAAEYPPLRQRDRRNFVILLTDGWQCCGLYENGMGGYGCESESRQLLYDQIGRLVAEGITPFVVGFGGSVDIVSLQRMAVTAGTSRPGCDVESRDLNSPDLCYYQANDQAALDRLLQDIVRQISDERCDNQDNDCDGRIDEGIERACVGACGEGVQRCEAGEFLSCEGGAGEPEICDNRDNDCDDVTDENVLNACGECGPLPAEVCDGVDNDCDGVTDPGCDCIQGASQPCGLDEGACFQGEQRCVDNSWTECVGAIDPVEETCNNIDDDCDGVVDEALTMACGSTCGAGEQRCIQGSWGACEGTVNAVDEICNGVDDECDGDVDEALMNACETACGPGSQRCARGTWDLCVPLSPPPETCNGIDDDCDGQIDEAALCPGETICRCGGCAEPCLRGECTNRLSCIDGYCEEDRCPPGSFCQGGDCVEGENPFDDEGDGGEGGGMMSIPIEGEDSDNSQQMSAACTSFPTQQLWPLALLIFALRLRRRARA